MSFKANLTGEFSVCTNDFCPNVQISSGIVSNGIPSAINKVDIMYWGWQFSYDDPPGVIIFNLSAVFFTNATLSISV